MRILYNWPFYRVETHNQVFFCMCILIVLGISQKYKWENTLFGVESCLDSTTVKEFISAVVRGSLINVKIIYHFCGCFWSKISIWDITLSIILNRLKWALKTTLALFFSPVRRALGKRWSHLSVISCIYKKCYIEAYLNKLLLFDFKTCAHHVYVFFTFNVWNNSRY